MMIDAESTLDRRGTQLLEEIEVPFPKIRLLINVTTDASEAAMEKVKADLHRFCPVSKVIRNAGTELEEVWNVTRP
jgi:putative redox protein